MYYYILCFVKEFKTYLLNLMDKELWKKCKIDKDKMDFNLKSDTFK